MLNFLIFCKLSRNIVLLVNLASITEIIARSKFVGFRTCNCTFVTSIFLFQPEFSGRSKTYTENYPVIFNIILWFGVAFFFSLLAICSTYFFFNKYIIYIQLTLCIVERLFGMFEENFKTFKVKF